MAPSSSAVARAIHATSLVLKETCTPEDSIRVHMAVFRMRHVGLGASSTRARLGKHSGVSHLNVRDHVCGSIYKTGSSKGTSIVY